MLLCNRVDVRHWKAFSKMKMEKAGITKASVGEMLYLAFPCHRSLHFFLSALSQNEPGEVDQEQLWGKEQFRNTTAVRKQKLSNHPVVCIFSQLLTALGGTEWHIYSSSLLCSAATSIVLPYTENICEDCCETSFQLVRLIGQVPCSLDENDKEWRRKALSWSHSWSSKDLLWPCGVLWRWALHPQLLSPTAFLASWFSSQRRCCYQVHRGDVCY